MGSATKYAVQRLVPAITKHKHDDGKLCACKPGREEALAYTLQALQVKQKEAEK